MTIVLGWHLQGDRTSSNGCIVPKHRKGAGQLSRPVEGRLFYGMIGT